MQMPRTLLVIASLVVVLPAEAADSLRLTPPFSSTTAPSLTRVALLQDDDVVEDEAPADDAAEPAAEEDPLAGEEGGAGAVAGADDKEIAVGGEKVSDDLGGATGFEFPTGFYMSADLGGFIRFGGYGDSRDSAGNVCFRCVPQLTSNLQPWVGINIGYDIIKNFGVELTLANGFIGEAAPVGYYVGEPPPPGNTQENSPENSAITMMNLGLTGSIYVLDRLALTGKGFLGGALLSPEPDPSKYNLVNGLACGGTPWTPKTGAPCDNGFTSDVGVAFGLGFGMRYATLLTDVVIGFDVNMVGVVSPNVATAHTGGERINDSLYLPPPFALGVSLPFIPALSFAPVIKYVF